MRASPAIGIGAACAGRHIRRTGGFTLVELMISASLMALILGSAYVCLNAAVSSQKLIEPRLEVVQTARVALALITADLRNACPLSRDYDFLGMHRQIGEAPADNLDFATHNYTPRRPHEGDFCAVSLFLDQDRESGRLSLWRRRNPRIAPDPLSGGNREEIAQGVRGLKFEYYDGLDWYDSWGDIKGQVKAQSSLRERRNLSGLPAAVRVTLWLDPNPRKRTNTGEAQTPVEPPASDEAGPKEGEPALMFQTVVRLNLADSPQTGPGSLSTNSPTAGAEGQTPTSGGNP